MHSSTIYLLSEVPVTGVVRKQWEYLLALQKGWGKQQLQGGRNDFLLIKNYSIFKYEGTTKSIKTKTDNLIY